MRLALFALSTIRRPRPTTAASFRLPRPPILPTGWSAELPRPPESSRDRPLTSWALDRDRPANRSKPADDGRRCYTGHWIAGRCWTTPLLDEDRQPLDLAVMAGPGDHAPERRLGG